VRRRLIDKQTAKATGVVALPLAVAGALPARQAPQQLLRLGFGLAMLGLAHLLLRESATPDAPEHLQQLAGSAVTAAGWRVEGGGRSADARLIGDVDGPVFTYRPGAWAATGVLRGGRCGRRHDLDRRG
jgi:uncharacterized membrane protein YfcA